MFEDFHIGRIESVPQVLEKEGYLFYLNKKEFIYITISLRGRMSALLYLNEEPKEGTILHYIQTHPEEFFDYISNHSIYRIRLLMLRQ